MIPPLTVILWGLAVLVSIVVIAALWLIAYVVMSAIRDGRRG